MESAPEKRKDEDYPPVLATSTSLSAYEMQVPQRFQRDAAGESLTLRQDPRRPKRRSEDAGNRHIGRNED